MTQGMRSRWTRIVVTGFGVLLCTNLVGCMSNWNKDKKPVAKQPTPGLYGTTQLGKNGMPLTASGMGGVQQTGGTSPLRTGLNTNTGGLPPAPNYSTNVGQPGAPSTISVPVQQGYAPTVQPAVNVDPRWNGSNTSTPLPPPNFGGTPPGGVPSYEQPLPPPPPGGTTATSIGFPPPGAPAGYVPSTPPTYAPVTPQQQPVGLPYNR